MGDASLHVAFVYAWVHDPLLCLVLSKAYNTITIIPAGKKVHNK